MSKPASEHKAGQKSGNGRKASLGALGLKSGRVDKAKADVPPAQGLAAKPGPKVVQNTVKAGTGQRPGPRKVHKVGKQDGDHGTAAAAAVPAAKGSQQQAQGEHKGTAGADGQLHSQKGPGLPWSGERPTGKGGEAVGKQRAAVIGSRTIAATASGAAVGHKARQAADAQGDSAGTQGASQAAATKQQVRPAAAAVKQGGPKHALANGAKHAANGAKNSHHAAQQKPELAGPPAAGSKRPSDGRALSSKRRKGGDGGQSAEAGTGDVAGASSNGAKAAAPVAGAAAVRGKAAKLGAVAAAAAPTAPATKGFSSNWEAMKAKLGVLGQGQKTKPVKHAPAQQQAAASKPLESKGTNTGVTQVVAMDCEMVGVGPKGKRSVIARVCIVNNDGNVLLDEYVQSKEVVTDYRTWVSGILPHHIRSDSALTLEEAQEKVAKILKGAILVGHALHNDLKAMLLDHPRKDTRDTGRYPPLMRAPAPGRKPRARSLKKLALEELGITIQEGAHTPVDDARAALYIYHKHRKEWERGISTGTLRKSQIANAASRKVLRDTLEAKAASGAAARKGRLGLGRGQLKVAQELEGNTDPYNRDVRNDPYADL